MAWFRRTPPASPTPAGTPDPIQEAKQRAEEALREAKANAATRKIELQAEREVANIERKAARQLGGIERESVGRGFLQNVLHPIESRRLRKAETEAVKALEEAVKNAEREAAAAKAGKVGKYLAGIVALLAVVGGLFAWVTGRNKSQTPSYDNGAPVPLLGQRQFGPTNAAELPDLNPNALGGHAAKVETAQQAAAQQGTVPASQSL